MSAFTNVLKSALLAVNSSTEENLKASDNGFTLDDVPDDNEFEMKGIWNHLPTITTSSYTYYENQKDIDAEKLMKDMKVVATDSEDGSTDKNADKYASDMAKTLKITKVEYSAAADGYKPETVVGDNIDGFTLDTYNGHLEKDETVEVKVTYSVKDSAGDTVTETGTVYVKYNYAPEISAPNLTFYTKEMEQGYVEEDGKKTPIEKFILSFTSSSDKEDQETFGLDAPEVKIVDKKTQQEITLDPSKMKEEGEYELTFKVVDSLGKSTVKTVKIFVTSDDPYKTERKKYIRFISKKYLYTLKDTSIWVTNSDYHDLLVKSLDKDPDNAADVQATLTFTSGH
jgi:hypothetical protein